MTNSNMNCPHCGINIDEHEANRCLNIWVAEVVVGWIKTNQRRTDHQNWLEYPQIWYLKPNGDIENITNIPEYSTDIAAAWEVVMQFKNQQYPVELIGEDAHFWSRWDFNIWNPLDDPDFTDEMAHGWDESMAIKERAASAPLAICRAAVKAIV